MILDGVRGLPSLGAGLKNRTVGISIGMNANSTRPLKVGAKRQAIIYAARLRNIMSNIIGPGARYGYANALGMCPGMQLGVCDLHHNLSTRPDTLVEKFRIAVPTCMEHERLAFRWRKSG